MFLLEVGFCAGTKSVWALVGKVLSVFKIVIPLLVIIFGMIDLGKAVISSDDKATKEAQSRLIKRCIYAIAVFFIFTLLNVLFTIVGDIAGNSAQGLKDWSECWRNPESSTPEEE